MEPSAPVEQIAREIDHQIQALPVNNTPNQRTVRRKYSRLLQNAQPEYILALARVLLDHFDHRWIGYELIQNHNETFQKLGEIELEELGQGINSWGSVDSFARILAGPAWLEGQISDQEIREWARSPDHWWRRAALVSTVALNMRSQCGAGDVTRTLEICRMLAGDQDDMVTKALSWALRELVPHDPGAVREFLNQYEGELAARVKREVRNKLTTGLKNPGRKRSSL